MVPIRESLNIEIWITSPIFVYIRTQKNLVWINDPIHPSVGSFCTFLAWQLLLFCPYLFLCSALICFFLIQFCSHLFLSIQFCSNLFLCSALICFFSIHFCPHLFFFNSCSYLPFNSVLSSSLSFQFSSALISLLSWLFFIRFLGIPSDLWSKIPAYMYATRQIENFLGVRLIEPRILSNNL